MSDAPFIKFYPSDFLGGTSGLSPAERGVYITLLCLIYEMDAPIQRDDARLARRCGAPKAAFVRILNELLDQGKITEADGLLSNRRAEKALMDRTNRTQNATHAAKSRWTAPKEKIQQNQQAENAGAMPGQCVADAKPEARSQKEKETPNGVSKKRRVGTRLKPDWVLPDDFRDWAIEQNYPQAAVDRQAEQFRDFWISKTGRDATKLDWFATWRNWMRNARIPQPVPNFSPPRPTSSEQQSQSVQRLVAVLEADERKRAQ